MTHRLYVFGAGAHGRKACQCALASGWLVAAFVDDAPGARSPVPNVIVLSPSDLPTPESDDRMFVAVGQGASRRKIMERLASRGWRFATLVHPAASVAPDVTFDQGVLVAAGAVVESGTRVGRGVIVDIGVLIDHDCRIGDFVHLRAGTVLAPQSVVAIDDPLRDGPTP